MFLCPFSLEYYLQFRCVCLYVCIQGKLVGVREDWECKICIPCNMLNMFKRTCIALIVHIYATSDKVWVMHLFLPMLNTGRFWKKSLLDFSWDMNAEHTTQLCLLIRVFPLLSMKLTSVLVLLNGEFLSLMHFHVWLLQSMIFIISCFVTVFLVSSLLYMIFVQSLWCQAESNPIT